MTVKDIVSPRISSSSPSVFQPQPPHFGIVTVEALPALTVLWDTAAPPVAYNPAATADLNIDVIEEASAQTQGIFTGKVVLRIAPDGAVQGDAAGGTSREFAATVVGIYRRRPLIADPAPDPFPIGTEYLLVKSGDLYFEDLATNFTVLKNR